MSPSLPPSAVPPSRFFDYSQPIWGRHSVVPHRNRSLRLGMAGRGSADTIIRFGWHVPRLRQRVSSSHGKFPGLSITVMMKFHEFRRGLAPGALRREHCRHGVVRKAADPASASEVDLDARPSRLVKRGSGCSSGFSRELMCLIVFSYESSLATSDDVSFSGHPLDHGPVLQGGIPRGSGQQL